MEERLQKLLARGGFASRRGSETLMLEGRVTINGEVVKELGTKADPARDDIRVDGVRVKAAREPVHIVLNKPRGVVTTRSDPEGRQTVMSLVPDVPGLFPVGRLDLTTEGLIILTNDGNFAERVSHPRFEVPRVYHAKVRGVPDPQTLARIREGVRVKDEVLAADQARLVDVDRHAWVEITLHEGKQHEVRRLLEAVGHPVSKLRRVAYGPVTLRGLLPGQFRALEPGEIAGLLKGEGSRKTPPPRTRRRPRPVGKRRIDPRKVAGPDAGKTQGRRAEGGKTAARSDGRAAETRKTGLGRTATERPRAGKLGAKTGAGRAGAGKAGTGKAGVGKAGVGRAGVGRAGVGKVGRSGTSKVGASRGGAGTAGAGRVGKAGATRTGVRKPGSSKTGGTGSAARGARKSGRDSRGRR